MRIRLGLILVFLVCAPFASAQVDCSSPENLCTGDPCVIQTLTIGKGLCEVDFRPRNVVIAGRLVLLSGAQLEIQGNQIDVNGSIRGSATNREFTQLELYSDGDLNINGPIRLKTPSDLNDIGLWLGAGNDLNINRKVQRIGWFRTRLFAVSDLNINATVQGRDGFTSVETRDGDINIDSQLIGRGDEDFFLDSGRDIRATRSIRARGAPSGFTMFAVGDIFFDRRARIVVLEPIIEADNITILSTLRTIDGYLELRANNSIAFQGKLDARKRLGGAPDILIKSLLGPIVIEGSILADSRNIAFPAQVNLEAGTDLTILGLVRATSLGGPGGLVWGTAENDLRAEADFRATGSPDGIISLIAETGLLDTTGSTFVPALSP